MITMYNNKEEALFVKACVIAANEEDSQGDVLSSEDIKRIFTSFNNQSSFEVWHQNERIEGVSLLENYINKAPETIGNKTAPAGSWLITLRIDNPSIKESVQRHEFEGVSLSSSVKSACKLDLPSMATYSMIRDMECINPTFISLVGKLGTDEGPSNQYPLEIMNYPSYIKKNKLGGKNLGFMSELKALIGKYDNAEETVETDASQVEKSEAPETEEPKDEPAEEVEVKKEECPQKGQEEEAETVVEKEATEVPVEEAATEETEEKEEEVDELAKLEERIKKLEEIVQELTKENDEPEVEAPAEEEEPKIQKSAKQIITDEAPVKVKSFNELTGRDSFGRKIRK